MLIYTVIAYRWGWTNAHHYQVTATSNAERACTRAKKECDDRGGKYGVAVYEWDDEVRQRCHAYYPSLYGESTPFENPRIEMFESIGHRVHELVTTGVEMVSFGKDGVAIPELREVPEWATRLVHDKERGSLFQLDVQRLMAERREQGLPPLYKLPDAQERWQRAGQQADALIAEMPRQRAQLLELRNQRLAEQAADLSNAATSPEGAPTK